MKGLKQASSESQLDEDTQNSKEIQELKQNLTSLETQLAIQNEARALESTATYRQIKVHELHTIANNLEKIGRLIELAIQKDVASSTKQKHIEDEEEEEEVEEEEEEYVK